MLRPKLNVAAAAGTVVTVGLAGDLLTTLSMVVGLSVAATSVDVFDSSLRAVPVGSALSTTASIVFAGAAFALSPLFTIGASTWSSSSSKSPLRQLSISASFDWAGRLAGFVLLSASLSSPVRAALRGLTYAIPQSLPSLSSLSSSDTAEPLDISVLSLACVTDTAAPPTGGIVG